MTILYRFFLFFIAFIFSSSVFAQPYLFISVQETNDGGFFDLSGSPFAADSKGYGMSAGWRLPELALLGRSDALHFDVEYAYHTQIRSAFPCDHCEIENTLGHHDLRLSFLPRIADKFTMRLYGIVGVNRVNAHGVVQNSAWSSWQNGWHAGFKISPASDSPYPVTWKFIYSEFELSQFAMGSPVGVYSLALGYEW